MNKILKIAICVLPLAMMAGTANIAYAGFGFGADFLSGLPQGAFQDNIKETGFGGHLEAYISTPTLPINWGLSLDAINYGSTTRRVPFDRYIPEVPVDITTNNNIMAGHVFMRLQNRNSRFRPYLEALAGFGYIYTKSEVNDIEDSSEPIAEATYIHDTTPSFGLGTGFMLRIFDFDPARVTDNAESYMGAFFINFGVRYLYGGVAEYVRKGGLKVQGDRVAIERLRSRTDLLTIRIGIVLEFERSEF